ncbi:DUF6985 domain-containing protein [Xanthobacteraceae bacterium A53D]
MAIEDQFFSALPSQHAGIARAGDDGDEIHLPAFAIRFPRLEDEWLPLSWQPETMDLTPSYRDALIAFSVSQEAIADRMLAAITAALPTLSDTYGEDLAAAHGPTIASSLVPKAVTFHQAGDQVLAGIELDCDWDAECGLGLLLRDGAVLGIGLAEVAFSAGSAHAVAKGDKAPLLWMP